MNLKVLTMLIVTTLAGCNSDKSPIKEDQFKININEDQMYNINLYDYFDQPMKNINVDLSKNDILTAEFDVQENEIKLNPIQDAYGEVQLNLNGEDANGTSRIFSYEIIINAVEDSPRLTVDDIKVEYNSTDKVYTGVDIYDVDSEFFITEISKNNDEVEISIEENKIYVKPNKLGLNKTISYEFIFNDKDEVYKKDINITIEYIKGQIPLTDESITSITVLEDTNYIGKLEPQKLYAGQDFEVIYDVSNLIGQLIQRDNYEFEYIPINNYNGVDKFKIIISNSDGDVVTKEIKITVVSDVDELIVENIEQILGEDTISTIPLNIIDPENNINYNFSVVSGLNNGTLDFSRSFITYTPNKDFFGVENIVINIMDTINNRSVDFSLKVTVISSLDQLAIDDKEILILRGHNYSELFSFYDAENSDFSFAISDATDGVTTISQNGTYTYQSNIAGSIDEDIFVIYVLDSNNRRTDEVTVTVKILDNNSPNELITVDEDTLSNTILTRGVIKGQESDYVVSIVSAPASGTITLNPDRTFNYKGLLNHYGTDSFSLRVKDVTTNSTYNVNYDVIINPIADSLDEEKINKKLSVLEDTLLTYDLSQLDLDKTGVTRYEITSDAVNGALSVNNITGVLTYNPNANFSGEDAFSARITKADYDQILDVDFNIRIIAGEDPLFLQSPIEIEMYESTKYSFNIRDITINEDPDEFIYIGDDLIKGTLWSIDTGNIPLFNITLDALTGQLTIIDLGLLSKNDIRNYKFSIRELTSGTVREFNIQIKIKDDLFIVNDLFNLQENLAELSTKSNILLCPGDYTVGNTDLILPENIGIYGMNNQLSATDKNMDVFYNCVIKDGESVIVIDDVGAMSLTNNTIISGVTFKKLSQVGRQTLIITTYSDNVEISNTKFISEGSGVDSSHSYIYGLHYTTNVVIKDNLFQGFKQEGNNVALDKRTAILLQAGADSLVISGNEFDNLLSGLQIYRFYQYSVDKTGVEIEISKNKFNNTDRPMIIESTSTNRNILTIDIFENIIENAIEAINIDKVSLHTVSYINMSILNNVINNSKNGININENGRGLNTTNLKINKNNISVTEGFGIKMSDQLLTSQNFNNVYTNVEINENDIQMLTDTLSEDNSGIIISVGYYDLISFTRDRGFDVNMLSNSKLDLLIEGNTIGNKNSSHKFNKYGIGFIKEDYDYNIVGSDKYQMNAQVNGNFIFARNDFSIDDDIFNNNKYKINLNMESNTLESLYPIPAFLLKENNTDLCLYFDGNTIDFMELYNEDANSTVTISDINNQGELSLFNNNALGNVLLTLINYEQIDKCH